MKEVSGFFNPKSIAVIGASNDENKVGGILFKKLQNFKGRVYAVNNSTHLVQGKNAFRTIEDIQEKVDMAIIAIPAEFVLGILEECGRKNVKSAIVISAGFAEIGKKEEEEKLLDIARKHGIRLLGPNCFGIFNPELNLDCTFSAITPERGNIAFISQSGALWSYVAELDGFSGFVSLGNMADLAFEDFIEYFSEDKKTKSIILYVEKLKNGKRFIEACRKCKKKIYAIKAGKSESGTKAAISHTGSLATDYEVYKGAFKQAGVELYESLEEALSKAGIKIKEEKKGKLKIGEVSIVTNAGGAAALASDYLADAGIKIKSLKDVLGTGLSEDYLKAINQAKSKNILVVLTPQYMTEVMETAEVLISSKNAGKNIIALFLGRQSVAKAAEILEKNKILCFTNLEDFRGALK